MVFEVSTLYSIGLITGHKDRVPVLTELTWPEVIELLSDVTIRKDVPYQEYHELVALSKTESAYKEAVKNMKDGPAFLAYSYNPIKPQRGKNTGFCTLLTLDVDCGLPVKDMQRVLAGHAYVIYHSFSSTPAKPKYRVVCPLDGPMSIPDMAAVCERIDAKCPNILQARLRALDNIFGKREQLYYLPAQPIGSEVIKPVLIGKGEVVTPKSFPLTLEEHQEVIDRIEAWAKHQAETVKINTERGGKALATQDGKKWVIPRDAQLRLANGGYVTAGSITTHTSGVECPLHTDVVPSEFMDRSSTSGGIYLACKHCGTIWVQDQDFSPTLSSLKLKIKTKPPADELEYAALRPSRGSKSKLVMEDPEADGYLFCLSEAARQAKLRLLPPLLTDLNLLLAPEGYGKSYMVKILADLGYKVLFCCKSNEQADEKALDFQVWSGHEVRRPISKAHNLYLNTGKKPISDEQVWNFMPAKINEVLSKQAVGELEFQEFYNNHKAEFLQNWHEADILCTTFAFASNMLRHGCLGNCMKKVVVMVDDPSYQDFCNLFYVSSERMKELEDKEVKLPDGQVIQNYEGHNYIELDITKFPFGEIKPYQYQGRVAIPKMLFTTTELLTELMITLKFPGVKVFDYVHSIREGKVCLLGTKLVRYKTKGFLVGATKVVTKRSKIEQVGPFGDGLKKFRSDDENLNHTNLKGRNDYKHKNIVVTLNLLSKEAGASLFLNFRDSGFNSKALEYIAILDKFHQAVRNGGYRFKGKETIYLCEPRLWTFIAENSRYKLSSHSCHFADYPTNHNQFLTFRKHLIVTDPLEAPSELVNWWKYFLACWPKMITDDLTLIKDLSDCEDCGRIVEEVRIAANAHWIDTSEYFEQAGTRKKAVVRTRRISFEEDPEEKQDRKRKETRYRMAKMRAKRKKNAPQKPSKWDLL